MISYNNWWHVISPHHILSLRIFYLKNSPVSTNRQMPFGNLWLHYNNIPIASLKAAPRSIREMKNLRINLLSALESRDALC